MKFVIKDVGDASENSSGGGTDGLLKEFVTMLVAYWVMIVSIVITGLVIITAVVYCLSLYHRAGM